MVIQLRDVLGAGLNGMEKKKPSWRVATLREPISVHPANLVRELRIRVRVRPAHVFAVDIARNCAFNYTGTWLGNHAYPTRLLLMIIFFHDAPHEGAPG